MTEQSPGSNPFGTPTTSGPQPIRSYQSIVNKVMRTLLRVPVISGFIGRYLLILRVTGRKSGKVYDIPLAYTRHGKDLLVGTAKYSWVRNIRGDVPVRLSLGGPQRTARAEVLTDAESVMPLFDVIARHNKNWAEFNGIGFDPDGSPHQADVYQTWQQGGVVLRLTPH
ncbi:nitroreductase/quinone reductase family protein [Nocardia huaxiensis]|uniref:Nitroreductase family deazaflavin-dependent oxidoreductase n=1 Tax=Nocardia huaxiensis TaxID=2755382 RepID=A0A7D6YYZ5_9NOCA|nr:nitroreductase/quinone reductase family protein [Nocardia huaxiensis]QLY27866.1 nitroreductase family deazaflavin-dependent oxidoreductase [Nocardia huaxiensis]UFS98736.1 nitroreductase family deazaflavin-dependent oxidoreductase [Nocardia huaxiensis]